MLIRGHDYKHILDIVKEAYSDPHAIKTYTKVGLWPSEKKVTERFFEPGSTVLDIGCGAGRTTIALARQGYEVTGIDLIPEMIKAAKEQASIHNVKAKFKAMNAVDIDFPDRSFQNVLFSFNGFEQIPGRRNRERVLKNVWRVLKNDGYFIFTARSGLATGRRTAAWTLITFEYFFYKLIKRNGKSWEFGDKLWKGEYHHYLNPFKLRTLVCSIGFDFLYFNSDRNIEKGHDATLFTNFSSDRALFYVFRKK